MASSGLRDVGLVFRTDGSVDFKKTLSDINSDLKENYAMFKLAQSALDSNASSAQKLAAKQQYLSSQVQTYRDKVERLETVLRHLESAEGDHSEEIKRTQLMLAQAKSSLNNYAKSLDEVDAKIRSGTANLDDYADKLNGIGSKASSAGQSMLPVTAAIGAAGYVALKSSSELEQFQIQFETLTGSAKKAQEVVAKLNEIAAKTPFETADLAEVTNMLMQYGLTADDAIGQMKILGDISMGNSDKMKRIATAYGQMSSAGKVQLEDIKQMIEAGFSPLQEISQRTGESMESLYGRISRGTLSVDEIRESMVKATSEGGKYYQAMDKQSQSLAGQLSTLKDNITMMAVSFGDILVPVIKNLVSLISGLTTWLNNLDPNIKAIILTLGLILAAIGPVLIILGQFATAISSIMNVASLAGTALAGMNLSIGAVLGPVALAIGAIVGLILIFKNLYENSEEFRTKFDGLLSLLSAKFDETKQSIGNIIKDLIVIIKAIIGQLQPIINDIVKLVEDIVIAVINMAGDVIRAISGLVQMIEGIVQVFTAIITGDWKSLWDGLGKILKGALAVVSGVFQGFVDFGIGIWNTLANGIKGAWDTIKGIVNLLKGIFNFKWSLPELKLPHFDISGGFSLLPPSVPKFSVKWYANGGILTNPSLLGFTGSTAHIAGEAGPEAVLPIELLRAYIQAENEANNVKLINILKAIMGDLMYLSFKRALQEEKGTVILDDEKVGEFVRNIILEVVG